MVRKNNKIFLINSKKNIKIESDNNENKILNINNNMNFIIYNRPKIAILFSGLHYFENYKHWSNKIYNIDFRYYYGNIKNKLINLFKDKYDIDIFICTNNSIILSQLLEIYKPLAYELDNENNRIYKTKKVLNLFKKYNFDNNYEFFCLTRFDIYFLKDLSILNYNSINITSILETNNLLDDNFYLIPKGYFDVFINTILKLNINSKNAMHFIKDDLKDCKIHYLLNENVVVKDLSFFKLNFFIKCNYSFIINHYYFSNDIHYQIENNLLKITNTDIYFKKINNDNSQYSWFGFKIYKKSKFILTFDFDNSINECIYLNNQKIEVIEKTNNIYKYIFTTVDNNSLLTFNFSNINYPFEYIFKNLTIKEQDIGELSSA